MKTEITEFSRLYRYDKRKREEKYNSNAYNFLEKTEILFCVFQKDKNLQSEMEKKCRLKIAEADYQYYEDQRTIRTGYCTLDPMPSTSTDIRFQPRIIQVKKAKSNYEAEKYAPGTKRSYEALQNDSSTTDSGGATDNEEFISEGNFTPQNRMPLPTLAMACERF